MVAVVPHVLPSAFRPCLYLPRSIQVSIVFLVSCLPSKKVLIFGCGCPSTGGFFFFISSFSFVVFHVQFRCPRTNCSCVCVCVFFPRKKLKKIKRSAVVPQARSFLACISFSFCIKYAFHSVPHCISLVFRLLRNTILLFVAVVQQAIPYIGYVVAPSPLYLFRVPFSTNSS